MFPLLGFAILNNVYANSIRFTVSWRSSDNRIGIANCHDSAKTCVASGERVVEGIKIYKPCWKYSYPKICDFPSKNDCYLIVHCYEVGLKECLMHDIIGNCVNQKKEFSCKRREISFIGKDRLKQSLKGDEARKIICKSVPCIDGNCVDKSYDMDADMMQSISQLYAATESKEAKDMDFQLFQGFNQHCTKKPTGYMSCCKVKGWGVHVGAECNQDEKKLQNLREKNLCVYVGKTTTGTNPFHLNKHHFCCFGNILNKVVQVEGRKQLGINFGVNGRPDCRGLTLSEIMSLDFEKMDFYEFTHEMKKRMKLPNISDIEIRVKESMSTINQENGISDSSIKASREDYEY